MAIDFVTLLFWLQFIAVLVLSAFLVVFDVVTDVIPALFYGFSTEAKRL